MQIDGSAAYRLPVPGTTTVAVGTLLARDLIPRQSSETSRVIGTLWVTGAAASARRPSPVLRGSALRRSSPPHATRLFAAQRYPSVPATEAPPWARTAASTADFGDENAAHTPSPVCLNNQPPCASIAARNTSSCAASAWPHHYGVRLPPTGRTLHIGQQKRHHPRWPVHSDSPAVDVNFARAWSICSSAYFTMAAFAMAAPRAAKEA